MTRVVAYFTADLTVGDICQLFEGNTNVYEYRLMIDGDVIVLVEP